MKISFPFPILTGPMTGLRWIVGSAAGPAGGASVLLHQLERAQLDCARRLLKPDSVCFDIGANVGLYTLLFSRYAAAVFAFEPLPRNLEFLQRTVRVNNCKNVTIVPSAVAATTGLTSFQTGANCAMGSLARNGDLPVSTVTIDEFIETYDVSPTLLKIDVEGAEADVLRGGETHLRTKHPDLLLSLHSSALRAECCELLIGWNYSRRTELSAPAENGGVEICFQK